MGENFFPLKYSLPSSCGDELIRPGESVKASLASVTVPLTGEYKSLAAFTLSNAPNVSKTEWKVNIIKPKHLS